MDELVTLEETDSGSDILLVVPKATVLQVRTAAELFLGRRVGGQQGALSHCTLPSAVASAGDLTGSYRKSFLQESLNPT